MGRARQGHKYADGTATGEPSGANRDLGADRGRQRGERNGMGTTADEGMRRGAQGRATEAGRWQVRAVPRWAVLYTGRGGGERAKREGLGTRGILIIPKQYKKKVGRKG